MLLVAAGRGWRFDRAPRLGAALAFYMALSLAPALVILLAIAGLAFGAEAAEGRLLWEIQGQVGFEGARVIQAMIAGTHRPRSGVLAVVLGLLPLFVSASSAVSELKDALDTIWKVPDDSDSTAAQSLLAIAKNWLAAFAMVLGAGLFLLVSLIVNAAAAAAGERLKPAALPATLIHAWDWAISFAVITALFAFIFKVLPNVPLRWSDVAGGAVLTSLLFNAGKAVLGVYLGTAGFAGAYGAAGSLVVLLVWTYYSAQVLFFGAEFTRAYTLRFGSAAAVPPLREISIRS